MLYMQTIQQCCAWIDHIKLPIDDDERGHFVSSKFVWNQDSSKGMNYSVLSPMHCMHAWPREVNDRASSGHDLFLGEKRSIFRSCLWLRSSSWDNAEHVMHRYDPYCCRRFMWRCKSLLIHPPSIYLIIWKEFFFFQKESLKEIKTPVL